MDNLPQSSSFCAKRLKVLADPSRLEVLKMLLGGAKHVWELNAVLGLEQSLLSHHLKILREQGFVETHRDGKAILYSIAPAVKLDSNREINLGCCVLSFDDQFL